ncbi:MAG: hypothetical protein QXY60_05240 [Saccharolobus sp.]
MEKHYTTTEACRILGVTTTMNSKVEAQSVLGKPRMKNGRRKGSILKINQEF